MTPLRLAGAAACAALVVSAGAEAARPPVALVASPARLSLAAGASGTVTVANSGTSPVVVDVARARFALDLRGRPRAAPRRAAWLAVAPARLALPPGGSAVLTVTPRFRSRPEPGDHSALVLLTTRALPGRGLPVRVRLGVVVVVRVPGRIVRRVVALRARARRSGRGYRLELLLANRGNVSERVGGACATVTLRRGHRLLARLSAPRRELLPRTTGIVDLRYAGTLRGPATVRVVIPRACGGRGARTLGVRLSASSVSR